jgi:carboxymethylenebutenolidase
MDHRAARAMPSFGGYMDEATEKYMADLWDEHCKFEFGEKDTEKTLGTMTEDPTNINVPTLMGGVGKEQVREFYSKYFIHQNPPDTEIVPLSRTIGRERLVDEILFKFTHTTKMDWMLPGIPPTGKRAEVPLVVIVEFREGKIASEHIYWDQATVLVQLGLLDANKLPVTGIESARKLTDPSSVPSDFLMQKNR